MSHDLDNDFSAYVPAACQRLLVVAEFEPDSIQVGTRTTVDRIETPDSDAVGALAALRAPAPYDVILSLDTLAMARAPRDVLEGLAENLSEGGLLLLRVPNIQYFEVVAALAEGHWQRCEARALAAKFCRYYSASELRRIVTSAGLCFEGAQWRDLAPRESCSLNASGTIERGRVSIGPLSDAEHKAFRARSVLGLVRGGRAA